MPPQIIDIPPDHECYPVQSRNEWGVLLIAHMHRVEDEAYGGVWACICRCCLWARNGDKGAL